MIGLMVFIIFTCGECGFSSVGSWYYSRECVWILGTKNMLHCLRKVKC